MGSVSVGLSEKASTLTLLSRWPAWSVSTPWIHDMPAGGCGGTAASCTSFPADPVEAFTAPVDVESCDTTTIAPAAMVAATTGVRARRVPGVLSCGPNRTRCPRPLLPLFVPCDIDLLLLSLTQLAI